VFQSPAKAGQRHTRALRGSDPRSRILILGSVGTILLELYLRAVQRKGFSARATT
jgi:hypothetical protein